MYFYAMQYIVVLWLAQDKAHYIWTVKFHIPWQTEEAYSFSSRPLWILCNKK